MVPATASEHVVWLWPQLPGDGKQARCICTFLHVLPLCYISRLEQMHIVGQETTSDLLKQQIKLFTERKNAKIA
jgi:hypothetical protein